MTRRFTPPWRLDERNGACFVVCDANGHDLAWVYYAAAGSAEAASFGRLTRDEARRVAANIARLPDLLRKP